MPIYQYKCSECGHITSERQGYDAETVLECEECGHIAERALIDGPIIRFKGDGWASTHGVIKDNE